MKANRVFSSVGILFHSLIIERLPHLPLFLMDLCVNAFSKSSDRRLIHFEYGWRRKEALRKTAYYFFIKHFTETLVVFVKSSHYRGQKVMARGLMFPKYVTRFFTFKIRREALGFKMPVFLGSLPLSHLEPMRAQFNRPWTLQLSFHS